MARFAEVFGLKKTQAELDFVNIDLFTDLPVYVDPFAISQRPDVWSRSAHDTIVDFFQRVVDSIRKGDDAKTANLLTNLSEPNETYLGLSRARPRGAGLGRKQLGQIADALSESSAVKTGILRSLEECELLIDGIGHDKVSDLTTNIIRRHLIEYTQGQCQLHGIPVKTVPVSPSYDAASGCWVSSYESLPVATDGTAILLVPKVIVRQIPAYRHDSFYTNYVLEFLKAEHLKANSSLVHTLRNGQRRVYKTDLRQQYPLTKANLFAFVKEHPQVLEEYREQLKAIEAKGAVFVNDEDPDDLVMIAGALGQALQAIPTGKAHASAYHSLMVGILEFLFFPQLLNPRKEDEIHQGRKRIDLTMENGASSGVFHTLAVIRRMPAAYIAIECKNYATEIANPELDQLAGRFSPIRGTVGILCCRKFDDRAKFIERCRDTLSDSRGLIVPIDDEAVLTMLEHIEKGSRVNAAKYFENIVHEVWMGA